jgi:hypothetical protein
MPASTPPAIAASLHEYDLAEPVGSTIAGLARVTGRLSAVAARTVGAASSASAIAAVRHFSTRDLRLLFIVDAPFSTGTVRPTIGSGGRAVVEAESRPSRAVT